MAERLVRALVAEDDLDVVMRLQESLASVNAEMGAYANTPAYVSSLILTGIVSPPRIDVLFLNHRLRINSQRMTDIGGKTVLGLLEEQGFLRTDTQEDLDAGIQLPDSNGIVVVGMGRDLDQARELATFSYGHEGPLTVDWADQPLRLGSLIQEVRYLKPPTIS